MRTFRTVHLLATLAAWAAAIYTLGLPWARDRAHRGDYLFGRYGLLEIYVGVPALLVALVLTALWLVPAVRRRGVAARAMVVTVATLLAVGVFDLGYALLLRGAASPQYWLDFAHVSRADNEPDDELGFRRKPGTTWTGVVPGTDRVVSYRVDGNGFRNPPGVEAAEVAFVGDSYTEAAQVEARRSFVGRVAEHTGRTVVNLGRGAYGPQQERIVLERYALTYRPRFVVWQLFDGNDLGDAEEFETWRSGDYREAPLRRRYLDNSFFRPLLDATLESKRGDFAKLRQDDGVQLPVTVRYRWRPEQVVERAEGWRHTEAALRSGVEACRAQGVEPVFVLVPVMARVLRDRLSFPDPADAARYTPADPTPLRDFGTALSGLCAELGVDLIDLHPRFRAAAATGADGLYIPRDEHLGERGHELIAAAVSEWLEAHR